MNKGLVVFIAVVAALGVLLAAANFGLFTPTVDPTFCQGRVSCYTYQSSTLNSHLSARVGETFIVQLGGNQENRPAGHYWAPTTTSGIQYLNYTVISTSKTCCPRIETRNYYFKATQAGSQTITFQGPGGKISLAVAVS